MSLCPSKLDNQRAVFPSYCLSGYECFWKTHNQNCVANTQAVLLLVSYLYIIATYAGITAYLTLYINTCSTVNELLHHLEMSFTTSQEESSRTLLLTCSTLQLAIIRKDRVKDKQIDKNIIKRSRPCVECKEAYIILAKIQHPN